MEKRVYTKEFKLGAVRMVVDQKMKGAQVCRDLGICSSSLSKWIADYKEQGVGAFPGKGFLSPEEQKMKDLEKKLRRTEMERDLLKKTIAFFAELDRKGMTP